jgi:Ribbon-helix-helix protein, copG family
MVDDYRSFLEKMISGAGAEEGEGNPTGRIPRATKTRQMNVKVTEELYARVYALASKLGVSKSVLLEMAIHTLEEALTGTR